MNNRDLATRSMLVLLLASLITLIPLSGWSYVDTQEQAATAASVQLLTAAQDLSANVRHLNAAIETLARNIEASAKQAGQSHDRFIEGEAVEASAHADVEPAPTPEMQAPGGGRSRLRPLGP